MRTPVVSCPDMLFRRDRQLARAIALAKIAFRMGQASACAGLQPRKARRRPAEAAPQTEVCPKATGPRSSLWVAQRTMKTSSRSRLRLGGTSE